MSKTISKKPVTIEIDSKTIGDAKLRMGLYKDRLRSGEAFITQVENAFRDYCKKHKGMTPELEDKYWREFYPFLIARLK